jgi:hypothetical protein
MPGCGWDGCPNSGIGMLAGDSATFFPLFASCLLVMFIMCLAPPGGWQNAVNTSYCFQALRHLASTCIICVHEGTSRLHPMEE